MANHKSAIKKIKQSQIRKLHNKYYAKTARNAIKDLCNINDKIQANNFFKKVSSRIDKLAKINIIHKNKASNLKSKLAMHINKLN